MRKPYVKHQNKRIKIGKKQSHDIKSFSKNVTQKYENVLISQKILKIHYYNYFLADHFRITILNILSLQELLVNF